MDRFHVLFLFVFEVRSDDLRALGWPRLADGFIAPDLVAARVHHLERLVAPPLNRQRVGDLCALLLLELIVVRDDIGDLEVDLHGLLRGSRIATRGLAGSARKHDARAIPDDGAEVELTILADHAHHVVEAERVDIIAADLVDGLDGDDGHHFLAYCLAHVFLSFAPVRGMLPTAASCHLTLVDFNYSW